MSPTLLLWLTLGSALGSALVAGVLFAFSSFVMPALARLPPVQGLAAMQSINVTVINRSFLGVFLGTGVACAVLAVASLAHRDAPGAAMRLAGALLYLTGVIALTRAFHIPRNNALMRIEADDPTAPAQWARYVASWTAGNHARVVAGAAAAALLAWSTHLA